MADKPVDEVVQVDAVLDALVSPTSSDVYEAVGSFSNDAVAAVAAKRALGAVPGGSPDLQAVLTEGNTASLPIALTAADGVDAVVVADPGSPTRQVTVSHEADELASSAPAVLRATDSELLITAVPGDVEETATISIQPGDARTGHTGAPVYIRGGKGAASQSGGDALLEGGACEGEGSAGANVTVRAGEGGQIGGYASIFGGTGGGAEIGAAITADGGDALSPNAAKLRLSAPGGVTLDTNPFAVATVIPATPTAQDIADALIAAFPGVFTQTP